jgi:hypothetical protein
MTEFPETGLTAWDFRCSRLALGFESGAVRMMELENFPGDPPIVTAWMTPVERVLAIGCPVCRRWFEIDAAALGAELLCQACNSGLKLNSFSIKADWRRLADAWGATRN